eukprot:CAMPEP_0113934378 /NCGR_PEP_ID=MMETSP1339-20121228/1708_1 /TAXON_ID=94617 /ORGANISM="Fibrocapsa japonica" /LENGTH=160 /DNA_ID=CAMNT_0000936159 /DNA_START=417 /DNA_END=899 /DNA_ORIENTATION=+ /assembly_acc=CAM_ASM_000762
MNAPAVFRLAKRRAADCGRLATGLTTGEGSGAAAACDWAIFLASVCGLLSSCFWFRGLPSSLTPPPLKAENLGPPSSSAFFRRACCTGTLGSTPLELAAPTLPATLEAPPPPPWEDSFSDAACDCLCMCSSYPTGASKSTLQSVSMMQAASAGFTSHTSK